MMKKLLIVLILALCMPLVVNAATGSVTITDAKQDNKTITVTGTATGFDEVMVSFFKDGSDDPMVLKTVPVSSGKFTATFTISFDKDEDLTIKVGDTDATAHDLYDLHVTKTEDEQEEPRPAGDPTNKITDEAGNSLTINDETKKFNSGDALVIETIDDFSKLSDEDKAKLDAVKKALGDEKELFALMLVSVVNGDNDVELPDTVDGYTLFINVPEEALKDNTNPTMARLLGETELELESGKLIKYDSTEKGYKATLNNVGIYVVYNDLSKKEENNNNEKSPKTGDNIMAYVMMAIMSLLIFMAAMIAIYRRRLAK